MSIRTKQSSVGRAAVRLLSALALLATAGCADPEDDLGAGGDFEEALESRVGALSTCNATMAAQCVNPVGYDAFGSNATTLSSQDYICVPTEFYQTTNLMEPFLYVDPGTSTWTMDGWGRMACVPQCCFVSNGGAADVRWRSGLYYAWAISSAPNNKTKTTAMWQGDAMAFIAGLSRQGSGGMATGDRGRTQWSSPTTATSLVATAYQTSSVEVAGYSFFVGTPGSSHNVKVSPAFNQTAYRASNGQRTAMIESRIGVCTFTKLAQVDPNARYPQIYMNSGRWWLTSTTTEPVEARCYHYNQSQ